MSKKAIVEVQLKWIFVLIAGVIILSFFVGVAKWYMDSKEEEIANDVMFKLGTILSGAEVSSNTARQIEIPSMELGTRCDPDACSPYGCTSAIEFIGTGAKPASTEIDVIFAPSVLETDIISAWTIEWQMPYKVTNFMYLAGPDYKYYLAYDDSDVDSERLAKRVFSKLTENKYVDFDLITDDEIPSVAYNDESLVKYVLFFSPGATIDIHDSVADSGNWDVIFLDEETVMFSKVSGPDKIPDPSTEQPHLGLPGIIGAIFSEDEDMFSCNMKKAFLKLRTINSIYAKRTGLLHTSFIGDGICEYYYDADVRNQFDAIENKISDLEVTAAEASSIDSAAAIIEEYNHDAILRSCPRLY